MKQPKCLNILEDQNSEGRCNDICMALTYHRLEDNTLQCTKGGHCAMDNTCFCDGCKPAYSMPWAELTRPKLTSAVEIGAEDAYGYKDIFQFEHILAMGTSYIPMLNI
uniref:Uncharacterized protein n=1 Tax=Romanomermis culicivorax TaxID=13658 RepID=A0A915IJL1_ROMCU